MKLSVSNTKQFLIFFYISGNGNTPPPPPKKKEFFVFQETEALKNLELLSPSSKNKKKPSKKVPRFSYISGNGTFWLQY